MNEQNYASLEESKRLVEAGIVLETEKIWHLNGDKETYCLKTRGSSASLLIRWGDYPAPSMAEVWRELPEGFEYEGTWSYAIITKSRKRDGSSFASYDLPNDRSVCGSIKHNTNPTDALIDLLIWVRKEKS